MKSVVYEITIPSSLLGSSGQGKQHAPPCWIPCPIVRVKLQDMCQTLSIIIYHTIRYCRLLVHSVLWETCNWKCMIAWNEMIYTFISFNIRGSDVVELSDWNLKLLVNSTTSCLNIPNCILLAARFFISNSYPSVFCHAYAGCIQFPIHIHQ